MGRKKTSSYSPSFSSAEVLFREEVGGTERIERGQNCRSLFSPVSLRSGKEGILLLLRHEPLLPPFFSHPEGEEEEEEAVSCTPFLHSSPSPSSDHHFLRRRSRQRKRFIEGPWLASFLPSSLSSSPPPFLSSSLIPSPPSPPLSFPHWASFPHKWLACRGRRRGGRGKALETKRREKEREEEEERSPFLLEAISRREAKRGRAVNVIYAYENCARARRNIKMSIKTPPSHFPLYHFDSRPALMPL